MILIVDSGSTKTYWIAIDDLGKELFSTKTLGLNPTMLSNEILSERIKNNFDIYNNRDKVFILIVPILEVEEIETTPQTREKNTRGTITNLKEAMKICPTTSNKPSVKKSIKINWPILPNKPASLTNLSKIPPAMAKSMERIILEVRVIN